MLYISPIGFAGSAMALVWFTKTHSPTSLVLLAALLLLLFCSTAPYVWMRQTEKGLSNIQMDLWIVSVTVVICTVGVCSRYQTMTAAYFMLGVMIVACKPQRFKVLTSMMFSGLCINSYNTNLYDRGFVSVELRMSDAAEFSPMYPIMGIFTISMWVLFMFVIHTILREHNREIQKSTNTAALCYAVAEKMVMYDTQAAQE
eukprot:PhF_6_TR40563/c0_g1_i2/m.60819